MTQNQPAPATPTPVAPSEGPEQTTRTLLWYGAVAGPLYVVLGTAQAVFRDGFDIRQHALSLLSNGGLGWIQITNFLLTGVLTIIAATGVRRALRGAPGGTWAPRMIALYGVGLIAAGIFRADPSFGFPPGTPDGQGAVSWHGMLHLVSGSIGFIGLIGACLVMARRFTRAGRSGWAVYSRVTGIFFLAAFVGIASGAGNALINITFTVAIAAGWLWLSATTLRLRREITEASAT
ncbi:DUF998 domain-containing protein [Dactylosporangium sp. NPDC049140]|uniref:DUF998 domain-containing protein n=1 Tax=Dactylosporangium sp. NPDC049140 TaxID=3155647 RepID=UPI0034104F64